MKQKTIIKLAGLCLLLCAAAPAEMRVWTDAQGNRFAGEFSQVTLGKAFIRDASGAIRSVPMDSLPEAELKYILAKIPPKLKIIARVQSRKPKRFEWSTPHYSSELYTFSVELERVSKLDYAGELSVELFVIGRERSLESNDRFVLMLHRQSVCQLPPGRRSCWSRLSILS